jgi:hypothetical protein
MFVKNETVADALENVFSHDVFDNATRSIIRNQVRSFFCVEKKKQSLAQFDVLFQVVRFGFVDAARVGEFLSLRFVGK